MIRFDSARFKIFQKQVWNFYKSNKREFAWRNTTNPYYIVVSEIMLQQTQTSRVEQKYQDFIKTFKDFKSLAQATQAEVLTLWVGLGYNRRALALYGIAQKVMAEYNGKLPDDVEVLKTFKGLGHATASSIVAFVFNKPTIFIETNIRAVFLHSFFKEEQEISDALLMPLVEATVCKDNPREWYYALMDYGVYLKKLHKNPSRKSKHHAIQSVFEGSDRQIRGAIILKLTQQKTLSLAQLYQELSFDKDRIIQQCNKLKKEGMIKINNNFFLSL